MSDGRKNNGGSRNGAGRKPKDDELKAAKLGQDAIIEVYGSIEKYWLFIVNKSAESLPHLKLVHEYVYGLPKQNLDVTSGGERFVISLGNGKKPDETT